MSQQFDRVFDAESSEPADDAISCPEFADDLLAYQRQELSDEQRDAVEAHLKGAACSRCREALREMEAFSQYLDSRQLQPREPSPSLFRRILATIDEEARTQNMRAG